MRAWVFRHRLRLRVVYGPPPEPVRPIEADPQAHGTAQGLKPGEWMWRENVFIIRPMTPPAA